MMLVKRKKNERYEDFVNRNEMISSLVGLFIIAVAVLLLDSPISTFSHYMAQAVHLYAGVSITLMWYGGVLIAVGVMLLAFVRATKLVEVLDEMLFR